MDVTFKLVIHLHTKLARQDDALMSRPLVFGYTIVLPYIRLMYANSDQVPLGFVRVMRYR